MTGGDVVAKKMRGKLPENIRSIALWGKEAVR
jgi:hypothetical protein